MKRTVARLLDFAVAVALLLALASVQPSRAAEWPNVRQSDTLWPLDNLGGPQWPNVPPDKLSKPQTVPAAPSPVSATAPNDAAPDQVGGIGAAAAAAAPPSRRSDDELLTGASLDVPPVKAAPVPEPSFFVKSLPSPFAFEAGARYWYSIGQNRFAFTNNTFPFGNPTSTLDWDRMQGHSGELFARVDHRPTGLFAKGMVGGGVVRGGDMDDLDFFVTQLNFSNTTSAVGDANLRYAMIDLGYAYEVPEAGVKFGGFVGYHYWHEKMTAFGILCNGDSFGNLACPAGSTLVDFGTAVVTYDTTWNAIRVGGEARFQIFDRLSLSGEIAFVPYAWVSNDDSHLLRQDPSDLGPVPNVLTRGWRAMGAEAEAFLNYQLLPNFEIGAGVRYWGLFTQAGTVEAGPTFTPDFPLTKFSTQRYGVLLQAKARF